MATSGIGDAAGQDSSAMRARRVLDANRALETELADAAASLPLLDLLLFLVAEDRGAGVTTARCCTAVSAPRTTALRWISALVGLGLVEQTADGSDRRITRLRLSSRAETVVRTWLDRVER